MATRTKKASESAPEEEAPQESGSLSFDLKPPPEAEKEIEPDDILNLGALDIRTKPVRINVGYGEEILEVREINMNEAIWSWNLFLRWSQGDKKALGEFVEWLSSLCADPLKKWIILSLNPSQIKALFLTLSPLSGNLNTGVDGEVGENM